MIWGLGREGRGTDHGQFTSGLVCVCRCLIVCGVAAAGGRRLFVPTTRLTKWDVLYCWADLSDKCTDKLTSMGPMIVGVCDYSGI